MTELNLDAFDRLVHVINTNCDERMKRILLGGLSTVYGHGGKSRIQALTGIAQSTLRTGTNEFNDQSAEYKTERIRSKGGGRKPVTDKNPELENHIQEIVESSTYGNPMNVLVWTTLSLRKIQELLKEKYNETISHVKVGEILEGLGYSKQ